MMMMMFDDDEDNDDDDNDDDDDDDGDLMIWILYFSKPLIALCQSTYSFLHW